MSEAEEREIYRSSGYSLERVTGRYIRCEGSKKNGYRFRIFETTTPDSGPFAGIAGMGPTIREYETDGSELPEDFRSQLVRSKSTTKWEPEK